VASPGNVPPATISAPAPTEEQAGETAVSEPTPTAVPAVDTDLEEVVTAIPEADGPTALRDDIQIRKIVDTRGGFIRIDQDPVSKALFYLNSEGKIFRLNLESGDGSKSTQVYTPSDIGGSSATTGMAFGPDGTLYVVSNEGQATTNRGIIRKGTPDSSGGHTWTTLAATEEYPKSNTQYDHQFNGVVVSPDGKEVYVNSGSRTEHGEVQDTQGTFPNAREVPLTSAIFRLPADGTDLVLPNDEAKLKEQGFLFADGLRNSYDLAFAPGGDLFATENGPDIDLPDEMNWIREGRHYGFPWRFGNEANPQTDPNYDFAKDGRLNKAFFAVEQGMYHQDPDFPQPPMEFTDPVANVGPDADKYADLQGQEQDSSDKGQPMYTFTPHRAPLGLSFDTAGALTAFKGDGFVLSWGWGIGDPTLSDAGQDLLHLKLTKQDDRYEAQVTQIARGFDHPIDSVLVGNQLYILEYGGTGGIWEVTLP
jgi:glucose/arabinose dehydrogenase